MKAFIPFTLLLFGLVSCGPRVLTETEISDYKERGQEIASATFQTLSGQLSEKMKEGGVPVALEYCNQNAYPLTDSLSEVHGVDIRRTALKYRNPDNAPNEQEKGVLNDFDVMLDHGDKPEPIVKVNENDQAVFYAPIMLAPNCVKCHGNVQSDIGEDNYRIIQQYYPKDKATDFALGDLRGMWSITFKD